MKPSIDLIGSFEKKKGENNQDYYVGQFDPAVFKKNKDEFQLILMPGNQLPSVLVGTEQIAKDSLYLFSQTDKQHP
jgi:hypothetical protein